MKVSFALAASAILISGASFAQAPGDPVAQHAASAAPQTSAPMSDGEVRKIDKEQGKVTLRHGPIANLDMPGMTMVFKVADPAVLDRVKEGGRVKFVAERMNGAIMITFIKAAD